MYVDNQLVLSDAQAFSADAVSTNTIDLGNVTPKNGLGSGEPMCLVVQVDVAADYTTGNETYQFNLLQDAAADLNTADILESRVIAAALLTAGSLHFIPIPPGAVTKRYIGAGFDGGGTTPTITATIFLTAMSMLDTYKAYAKGYTIS